MKATEVYRVAKASKVKYTQSSPARKKSENVVKSAYKTEVVDLKAGSRAKNFCDDDPDSVYSLL
jgi:hypothetical protein